MAGVDATLDNHGKKTTPTMIKSAEHRSRTVTMPDAVGEQVISRQAADTVTSVLTGVVDDGTAQKAVRDNPRREGRQVAGKTGTSDNNKSAWFTGFTPGLVTSVGLFGEDDKAPHPQVEMYGALGEDRVNGGGPPARIWAEYTFGVAAEGGEFDLDTEQGAAVKPPRSSSPPESPSNTPSQEETSEAPTTQAPPETSSAPPTSEPPTTPPETTPPPTKTPTNSTTFTIPGDPDDPGDPEFDGDQ